MARLISRKPIGLKLLFAGRPELESSLFTSLCRFYRMKLALNETEHDIDRYITTTLDQYLEDHNLILGDPMLIGKIYETLRQGSRGM